MTPPRSVSAEERLKELVKDIIMNCPSEDSGQFIADRLSLAYSFGYDRGFKDGDKCTAQSIAKARNETLEEAARVAESSRIEWEQRLFKECASDKLTAERDFIAEKIRKLKSDGK